MSSELALRDMLFQGTVWGPQLWNTFFCDAKEPVHKQGFTEVVYADDLNTHKSFSNAAKNEDLLKEGARCQQNLHAWGRANQVSFDPGKESFHVVARTGGQGGNTELLGVNFDMALTMEDAVRDTMTAAN